MSHTAADLGLHGYKNWVKNLQPLSNGTVIRFKTGYSGVTKSTTVNPNQEMIILSVGLGVSLNQVYKMVVYRNGKTFKKESRFSVESIARWLIDGECEIVKDGQ